MAGPLEIKKAWYERAYKWAHVRADKPAGKWWLALWSFTESAFFPVPPDVMLIALIVTGAKRWLALSLLTSFSSVVGGLLGYIIGFALFDTIGVWLVNTYGLHNAFAQVGTQFSEAAFTTILLAAFTPIPYKVFTIAAGFFHVSVLSFVAASIVGRTARFVLVGWITQKWGRSLLGKMMTSIELTVLVLGAAVLAALFIL